MKSLLIVYIILFVFILSVDSFNLLFYEFQIIFQFRNLPVHFLNKVITFLAGRIKET